MIVGTIAAAMRRTPIATETGFRLTAGDMQSGTDKRIPAGDMQSGSDRRKFDREAI